MASKEIPGTKSSSLARTIAAEDLPILSEFNQIARFSMDDDHINILANSIALEGQHEPALIRTGPDNRPQLWGGRHRKAAILKINSNLSHYNKLRADAGLPEIKEPGIALLVVHRQATDAQIIQATFSENNTLPYSVMDLANYAHNLRTLASSMGREITHSQIAVMMSTAQRPINAARVSTLLNLIRAPYHLQLALHQGKRWMREAVLQALLRMELSAIELEEMATKLESGKIKPSEILAMQAEKSRAKGKKVQRSISDLKRKLAELDQLQPLFLSAGDLSDWLAGEVGDNVWEEAKDKASERWPALLGSVVSDFGDDEGEGEYEMVDGKAVRISGGVS